MQAAALAHYSCRKIPQLPRMNASPGFHYPLLFSSSSSQENKLQRDRRGVWDRCAQPPGSPFIPPGAEQKFGSSGPCSPESYLMGEWEGLRQKPHRPRQEAGTGVEFGHYLE